MRRKRYGEALGVLTLLALGVLAIAYGIAVVRAGKGTDAYDNYYGQQQIGAFAIPFGAVFVLLALLIVATHLRRRLEIRRLSRQYGDPDPDGDA